MSNGLSKLYSVFAELEKNQSQLSTQTLSKLFDQDSQRCQSLTRKSCGLLIDYTKNHVNQSTLNLFEQLIEQADFKNKVEAMFNGDVINHTEKRKVLHTALRSPHKNSEEEKAVHQALEKISSFIDSVHGGKWLGHTDKKIEDVVNIGIGGSDLGPRMVCQALAPMNLNKVNCHFVANIDGADIDNCLKKLNPETTLFIIASKSFSTLETLENGKSARSWLINSGCATEDVGKHFVAITSNVDKAVEFGIESDNCFPMWDWVGGRYSLWSAIGLPIAMAVGMNGFKNLLAGAHEMDVHFKTASPMENLPLLHALMVFWYTQFWQVRSQAILPYNNQLGFFPAYLQQLEMESLGKSCDNTGKAVDYQTGIVVWGTEGTNGQHSFHQLLHQGTQIIPADFIVCKNAQHELDHHQQHLIANCLSQSQALMCGKTFEQAKQELLDSGMDEINATRLAQDKIIPGNRPSTTIVLDALTPKTLGALIALYEHKVFSLSILYNINAFDQWGVELGKQLSGPIYKAVNNEQGDSQFDPSTKTLIDLLK